MKCSVCGTESNADARFCSNCGAKLHREADTLFRTTGPVDSPAVAAAPPAVATTPRAPRRAGWFVLGAALIVAAYVAYRQFLPTAATAEGDATAPTATSASPAPAPPATPASEAGTGSAPPAPAPAATPAATTPPSASTPARGTAPPKPTARPRPAKPPPPPPQQPVAAAPPPAPAAAAVAIAPPRPDRFQQLNDALARCKGRDLIGRAVCEQRARLQYCDGYWDQAPQCSGIGKLNPAAN